MKKFFSAFLAVIMILTSVMMFASCKKQDAMVVVVGYTIYEPMNYFNDDNEFVGFDTELARAVFEDLGYTVVFKEIEWKSKYTDLASGNIDCIWNGFTANSADDDGVQRKDKVDFSYNYMENRQVVVTKSSEVANVTSKDSLADKIGYAETGSVGATYAEDFTGAIVKTTTKQTEAIMQVKSNAAYFAVVDAQLAKSIVGKGDYSDLAIVDAVSSTVEYYAIGFEKGSELTAKVNETLEKLASSGKIAELAEKYGVSSTVITDFSDQK